MDEIVTCSVCDSEFDVEREGGLSGLFGILPIAYCPTCLASAVDMVHQLYPCPHCDKLYGEDDTDD